MRLSSLLVVLLLAGAVTAQEEISETEELGAKKDLKWDIEGYLRQDVRVRLTEDEHDVDLYTTLFADMDRVDSPWTVRVNARLYADVDGKSKPDDLLRDFFDGFDTPVQVKIYEIYGQVNDLMKGVMDLRVGRQFLNEGIYLHFDGLRTDFDLNKTARGLTGTLFFGIPVKLAGFSGWESNNWILGALVRYRVGRDTRLRFEYYHVNEEFDGINDPIIDPILQPVSIPATTLSDDLFGLSAWHAIKRQWRLFGRFTILNGRANELNLRVRWADTKGQWQVVGEWFQLFGRLRNVTNDLTPYAPMLGVYEPFWRLTVRATRYFSETWVVQLGGAYRALEDSTNEGVFNHEYGQYYVTASRLGLFRDGFDVNLTLTGFESDRNSVMVVGGHVDFEVTRDVSMTAGIDFSLYKYDFFMNTEREDVWSYSVRVRWRSSKTVTGEFDVLIDDDRFATYTTFRLAVTVRF